MKKFVWLLVIIIIYAGVWWLFGHPGFQFTSTITDKETPVATKKYASILPALN